METFARIVMAVLACVVVLVFLGRPVGYRAPDVQANPSVSSD